MFRDIYGSLRLNFTWAMNRWAHKLAVKILPDEYRVVAVGGPYPTKTLEYDLIRAADWISQGGSCHPDILYGAAEKLNQIRHTEGEQSDG